MSEAYFSVSSTKAGWLAALEESRKAQLLNDAAPMLLEALEAMLEMHGSDDEEKAARDKARAAIAKARGEA